MFSRPRLVAAATSAVLAASLVAAAGLSGHPATTGRPSAEALPLQVLPNAPTPAPTTTTTPRRRAPATTPAPTTTTGPIGLTASLDAILANTTSCLEVRSAGRVVYDHDAAQAMAPASTQKLLVAAAALDVLGPAYRFTTSVVAVRPPRSGEVDDLWLVGGGDPVLSSPEFTAYLAGQPETAGDIPTTQLSALVTQLFAAGVRTVPGGIHGDDSRYDRLRFLPSWKPIYVTEADVAPLGALEADHGLDRWHPDVLTADPTAHAAGVLARLAATAGIAAPQATDATGPPGAVVLAAIQSPPLADIVSFMLRTSDNTIAEMLTRELDRVAGGRGTTTGGVDQVELVAARLGLPTAGLSLVDGSGLSPDDRATCSTLIAAMSLGSRAPFQAISAGLAVAARSGTLIHRFVGTPAAGRLVAKTGSIDGVAGMVGVYNGFAFALIANGDFPYQAGTGLEDRVVAALTSP